jgi:hypothetical protein
VEVEVEGRDVVGTLRLELKDALALVDESKGEVDIAVVLVVFTGEEEEEEEEEEEDEVEDDEEEEEVEGEVEAEELETTVASLFKSRFGITSNLFLTGFTCGSNISLSLFKKCHSFFLNDSRVSVRGQISFFTFCGSFVSWNSTSYSHSAFSLFFLFDALMTLPV